MNESLLFVYGTLRPGFDGPMARWLQASARHIGPASAVGLLYHVADYPGFVPGSEGRVAGDLFVLDDADAILAVLDEHEECAVHFPAPHEYRRERLRVHGPEGPAEAWTYVYACDTNRLLLVAEGDYLA